MNEPLLKLTITNDHALKAMGTKVKRNVRNVSKKITADVAEDFYKFLRRKWKAGALGLEPLSHFTVEYKRKQKMKLPSVPEYGLGEDSQRSYFNSIVIRKVKEGTRVSVEGRKIHHSGLTMKKLAILQAEGYTSPWGRVPGRNPFAAAAEMYNIKARFSRAMKKILKGGIKK